MPVVNIDDARKQLIKRCFALARDIRLSPASRRDLVQKGKQLRSLFRKLAARQFNRNTTAYLAANSEIAEITRKLAESARGAAEEKAVVEQVGRLAAVLDDLVKAASSA